MRTLFEKMRWVIGRWSTSQKPEWLTLWPLLAPALLLLPSLTTFPFPDSQARFSDLVLTHYPYALFFRQAIAKWGCIPLWSPGILSGAPFAANPLSGLWYPPGWLALLLPLPLGFNLLVIVHLVWGGVGMLRLLQSEGLHRDAAMFGAVAFEMMPKLFAHYGAGHLTLLYAIPWTPWLLYCQGKSLRQHFPPALVKLSKQDVWPAVMLGVIFLADPRWTAYAGSVWFAYSIWICRRQAISFLPSAWKLLRQVVLAGLFTAPSALPLLEYTGLSTRASLKEADFFAYSFPISRSFGFFFPDFGGFHEWIAYAGAVVLLLFFVCISASTIRKDAVFWIILAFASLFFAFGSQIPFLTVISRFPGLSMLRVPSRALFLTGFSLAVSSAYGLDHLLPGIGAKEQKPVRLTLLALVVFSLLLTAGVVFVTKKIPGNFLWGAVMVLAAAGVISASLSGKLAGCRTYILLFLLSLVDLGMVDRSLFSSRAAEVVLHEQKALAEYLVAVPGNFRVYSPSYSLPYQVAANYGLQSADGIDPLQLSAYVSFMQSATGVPVSGYSVTLPSFASGDPDIDNRQFLPDAARLGLLNVRFVAAEYDLNADGLVLSTRIGNTRIYENLKSKPRAWVEPAQSNLDDAFQAHIIAWSPNEIEIQAKGPGMLILSENYYPGWRAWVDGVKMEIVPYQGFLRSVSLSQGDHLVKLSFQPDSLFAGLSCFFIGLLWVLSGEIDISMRRKVGSNHR